MAKFKAPEDITALGMEDLSAALDEARSASADFAKKEDADFTDEEAEEFLALGEFATSAQARMEELQGEQESRNAALANARQALAAKDEKKKEDEEEVIVPVDEVVEVVPEEVIPEEVTPEDEEEEKRRNAATLETEAAASKGRESLTRTVARSNGAPKDMKDRKKDLGFSLTAAADVRGVPAGKEYSSLSAAGEAITSRLNSYPKGAMQKGLVNKLQAFQLQLPENQFNSSDYMGRHDQMLNEVGKESRLAGGSLIAAGGWGAPSDLVRDFCEIEDIGNLFELPEFSVIHGGVQYTKGPTFADVFGSATGFWDMDEATADAGTELKTSIRPVKPDFIEERLDAVGAMMEAGLLLRAGYPELVERYASLVMTAHQYKIAMKKHTLIEEFLGAAVSYENGFGNALDILHVLELVATGERQRNAMGIDATMEVVLPYWVKPAIRADLSNRSGVSDFTSVTDAQIDAHFTARNLRVQWVNAFQNLTIDPVTGLAKSYPDTFRAYMYPAGTYVVGVADVITLDTIYDSVNLKKNDYVHLFTEQGMLLTNPCGDGVHVEIPLNITGKSAAQNIDKELFAPTAP